MQYDDIAENSFSDIYNSGYRARLKELFSAGSDHEPEYVITGGAAARMYMQPSQLAIPEHENISSEINDNSGISSADYEPEYDAGDKKAKWQYDGGAADEPFPPEKKGIYKSALFVTLCMLTALVAILISQFFF